jgi:uncharacterized YigZ family protein
MTNLFFYLLGMDDSYKTIEKPAEGIFRDRNSRFLAFGYPAESVEEVNNYLAVIKKKYHDARHHCYAYRIGYEKDIFKLNDDGEPAGTAGKPIFRQLESNDLTNILVVVVRYFGGILLGTGRLINAYKSSVMDMLANASIVTRYIEDQYSIHFPYEKLNMIMKILRENGLLHLKPEYNSQCNMDILVRKSIADSLIRRLSAISGIIIDQKIISH